MLGRTNTGGGGSGGLNFQVIGGTTAPSNPKENMIWVNTSTKITSYIFSAPQPTGSAGMVWIDTGTSSPVEFNALKKNGIQVYPISARQYTGGAWVYKTAKSWQGGAWVDWIRSLFYYGDTFDGITGGYIKAVDQASTASIDANGIHLNAKRNSSNWLTNAEYYTSYKIDLSDYTKLCAEVNLVRNGNTGHFRLSVLESRTAATAYAEIHEDGNTVCSLDISSLTGSYHVSVLTYVYADSGDANPIADVTRIWLE